MAQDLPTFQGVIPILQTPFFDDGSLDLDSLRREVHLACGLGVKSLAFPGFVSEWWKLSDEEILRCAEVIASSCKDSTVFIANVTAQSTFSALQQVEMFQTLGARALMCLPPTVFPLTEEAALGHLRAVVSAAPIPVILQYADPRTHTLLSAKRLVALHREHPNFCGVKLDFSPAGPVLTELVQAFRALPVTFLVGFAGLHLPDSLARGAHGFMPGAGHLPTDIQVFHDLLKTPQSGILTFERLLLPLINFEMQTIEFSIAVHKWLLQARGVFESDYVRPPGFQITGIQRAELAEHWERVVSCQENA